MECGKDAMHLLLLFGLVCATIVAVSIYGGLVLRDRRIRQLEQLLAGTKPSGSDSEETSPLPTQ